MRDSPSASGRGGVNLDDPVETQRKNISNTRANAGKRKVDKGLGISDDAGDTLNTQQIDALKQQFLENDPQLDDSHNARSHDPKWPRGAEKIIKHINALTEQRKENDTAKKDTPYNQLQAQARPLVSETQLQGLFEDTQFNNGFAKLAGRDKSKETQDVHGQPLQSQDTQFFDNLKEILLDDKTQLGDSQVEAAADRIVEQAWISADAPKNVESERAVPAKDPEEVAGDVPSQANDSQFIEGLKAQFLDSVVEDSQNAETSIRERTVLTENSEETQRSDQVVLFPPGICFGGGGIAYSQSQPQLVNGEHPSGKNSVASIEASFEENLQSQVPAPIRAHQRLVDNPRETSTSSHLQSHPTTISSSAQPTTDHKSVSAPKSKQTKRKTSQADIKRLQGRAMDDWQRDSLGAASQTQENDPGPRYGLAAKPQEERSITKQGRGSATQSTVNDNMDVDRTYNENESGAVRLDLGPSQLSQDLAVSQDQGMRSPSYDFARGAVDDVSQVEPETPAPAAKNPFGKTGVPMGMSQVFAATQSSPLDLRFLQSDGARPSSPGIGLPSSPVARRGLNISKTLPVAEASSPSHVTLTVSSSFQPFDESTQPEAIRNARAQKAKSPTPIPDHIRAEAAKLFAGRREPVDYITIEELQERRWQTDLAMNPPDRYESDDGMDDTAENARRAALKRAKDAAEKQLREASDLMAPRRPSEERPSSTRTHSKNSSERVIKKNNIREARMRKSEERASAVANKKLEEVEVPASCETTKEKTSKKKSHKRRSQSEECRAQSVGLNARDTQNTESQSVVIRNSQVRSSQQEVIVDSQNNISTQAETNHGSLEAVKDSRQPPTSATRSKYKLNRASSAVLPILGKEDINVSAPNRSSPPVVSVLVTSSGHYLKTDNQTPCGSKTSSGMTLPEVVPETSPASKTASPAKLPFEDLDMVDDTPMQSFSDIRMTQDVPNENDITPTKITRRHSERHKTITYGKKSPIQKRPEQVVGKGAKVAFTEEPSDLNDEEKINTTKKGKKGLKKGITPPKGKQASKSAKFVIDEDSEENQPEQIPISKKTANSKGKQIPPLKSSPAAKAPDPPLDDEGEDANTNALSTIQRFGRGKGKDVIPRKLPPKVLKPAVDPSPGSSPIRPERRSARRQPSDLKNQSALPIAPVTFEDHDIQESSDDDAPIARPVSNKRQDVAIQESSDTEMADARPVKKANKLRGTALSKSAALLLINDDEDEDGSVSPIRQSIEAAPKLKVCPRFMLSLPCTKNHSVNGMVHDAALKALSQKRRGSTDVPSTASPGKSASPVTSASRDSRSASAFTRPDSADAPRLPPIGTGGLIHREPQVPQPQPQSEYAAAQSSLPKSFESSPLSDLASDLADELEELHTAAAGPSKSDSSRSRSGTAMSDAAMMPPPQTVTRTLDFAAPKPPAETPSVPQTGGGKGNKRSASTSGRKDKKAAKTTPNDTPSRSRRATRSASAALASVDEDDDKGEGEEDTLVVRDTPRAAPVRPTRQGRVVSRTSYAESPSDNGSDNEGPGPATATARPISSNTPSLNVDEDVKDEDDETSDLFKGMAFAVSYKHGDTEAAQDREEITKLILANGGELIEDFKDLFEKTDTDIIATPAVSRAPSANTSFATGSHRGSVQPNQQPKQDDNQDEGDLKLTEHAKTLGFVAFIGDTYSRKSKFLQALALSLPCLNSIWIRECVRTRMILRWISPYMLAAGESRKLAGMPCSRDIKGYSAATARFEDTFGGRKKMLEGKGVLFLFLKSGRGKAGEDVKLKREHYLWLTRALGAREVRRVQTAAEARILVHEDYEPGQGWDIVYVDDGDKVASVRREVENRQMGVSAERNDVRMQGGKRKRVKIVSDEFVVQSLILGCLEDEDIVEESG